MKCVWCEKTFEGKVFPVVAKAKGKKEKQKYVSDEPFGLEVTVPGFKFKGIAVSEDSPFKKNGYDMVFCACSEKCRENFMIAVKTRRKSIFDLLKSLK